MTKENSNVFRSVAVREIVLELEQVLAEFNAIKEEEIGKEAFQKVEAEYLERTKALKKQLVAIPAGDAESLLVKSSFILKDRIEDYGLRDTFDWQRESMVSLLKDLQAYLIRQSEKEKVRHFSKPKDDPERQERVERHSRGYLRSESEVRNLKALADIWDDFMDDNDNVRHFLLNNFSDIAKALHRKYFEEDEKPEALKEAA